MSKDKSVKIQPETKKLFSDILMIFVRKLFPKNESAQIVHEEGVPFDYKDQRLYQWLEEVLNKKGHNVTISYNISAEPPEVMIGIHPVSGFYTATAFDYFMTSGDNQEECVAYPNPIETIKDFAHQIHDIKSLLPLNMTDYVDVSLHLQDAANDYKLHTLVNRLSNTSLDLIKFHNEAIEFCLENCFLTGDFINRCGLELVDKDSYITEKDGKVVLFIDNVLKDMNSYILHPLTNHDETVIIAPDDELLVFVEWLKHQVLKSTNAQDIIVSMKDPRFSDYQESASGIINTIKKYFPA